MASRVSSPWLAVMLLLVAAVAGLAWWFWPAYQGGNSPETAGRLLRPPLREVDQAATLDPLPGGADERRTSCVQCHAADPPFESKETAQLLQGRSKLDRDEWFRSLQLEAKCGVCHLTPDPSNLPAQSWSEVVSRMEEIMETRQTAKPPALELADLRHYYYTFSPERPPALAPDPAPEASPVQFKIRELGDVAVRPDADRPVVGQVQICDLDQDQQPDLLVCDTKNSALFWLRQRNGQWQEESLATLPHPARARIVPGSDEVETQIAVACLGRLQPTDDPVGRVILLHGGIERRFAARTILEGISRVADVAPGDFDGDGDLDFVVAAFGWITQGEVGWLENQRAGGYLYRPVVRRTGAMQAWPVDLNEDGRLDFVALFAQEHELISVFLNQGEGTFQEERIYQAPTPAYGSSGFQMADLDGDNDLDILYANGDNMDLPTIIPRPHHGVQWLENRGGLEFVRHEITRFYGAYGLATADLNRDGHLDIVASSLFNDWADQRRASLLWLENNGHQQFTAHAIATNPIHLISCDTGDLDEDGWPDVAASGLNGFPPFERAARIVLWQNLGSNFTPSSNVSPP